MRTLNHVLSLSFEHCENDITVIVLIPVVTLKRRERARETQRDISGNSDF